MTTATPERRARRQAHLLELTQTPTAAGLEQRVHAWVERFLQPHASALDVVRDGAGNWLVLQRRRQAGKPLVLFTAHLDHRRSWSPPARMNARWWSSAAA